MKTFFKNRSLELAEDISIFCGDAGGLQDRHPKGEKISNPQVLQRCVERAVQTGLQRILQLICTSCDERGIKARRRLKCTFQVGLKHVVFITAT